MPPAYAVERSAPAAVRADLERLWDSVLTLDVHPADKFAWLYAEAPQVPDTVLMLRGDGALVGTAGVGVRRFQLGDATVTAGLLADLAVEKAHRSVGPALALVRAGKALVDERHALAYGFPNRLAEGVFKRAGYQVLGTIGRHVRPLRHASFVDKLDDQHLARLPAAARPLARRAAQTPALVAIAGRVVDAALLVGSARATLTSTARLVLADAPRPDADHDALWDAARGRYTIVGERTRRFLAWRFLPRPGRAFWTARTRDGELRAYAVVDRQGDTAFIRDLFGHPDDVVALLARLPLIQYLAGASSLAMRYLGARWVVDALAACGFASRPSTRTIVATAGATCPAGAVAQVGDAASWHLTDADEDT